LKEVGTNFARMAAETKEQDAEEQQEFTAQIASFKLEVAQGSKHAKLSNSVITRKQEEMKSTESQKKTAHEAQVAAEKYKITLEETCKDVLDNYANRTAARQLEEKNLRGAVKILRDSMKENNTENATGLLLQVKPHSKLKVKQGVEKTVLVKGDGIHFPKSGDTVTFFYTGKLTDGGRVFDSRHRVGTWPLVVQIGGMGKVIKGLDEGVLKMSVGEKAVLKLTPDDDIGVLGVKSVYLGNLIGHDNIVPRNASLTFEVELVRIQSPADLAKIAAADAAQAAAKLLAPTPLPTFR